MRSMVVVLLVCLGFSPLGVNAQLSVNKSVVEISSAEPRSTIRLTNSGPDTLYVNLKLHEVLQPQNDNSPRQLMVDPIHDGVLVHPTQLILQPGQTRSARVVLTEEIQHQDRVFRLELRPLAGDALPNGLSDERSAGVQTLLGYQLLVLARPARLSPDVKMSRVDDAVVFSNLGNTSVLLRKLEICAQQPLNCVAMRPNRLYPGEVLSVPMPAKTNAATVLVRTLQSVSYTENTVEYLPD